MTAPYVDWPQVIADIVRSGISYGDICTETGVSRDKLCRYSKHGSEPRHSDGMALLALWCHITGREHEAVPVVGMAEGAAVSSSSLSAGVNQQHHPAAVFPVVSHAREEA